MQKPLGNSELGSSVCNQLLLWLKSWPLKSLRFALDLVLSTGFHLCRNEPYLRREQDVRLPFLPGDHCQPVSNLAEAGKEEKRLQCQVPSASCSCLPSPSWRASPYLLDGKQPHHVHNNHVCLLCTWGQAALNPATLPSAVPCPGGGNQKVQKAFMRGKARD